jgi:hypothetical protein
MEYLHSPICSMAHKAASDCEINDAAEHESTEIAFVDCAVPVVHTLNLISRTA